MPDRGRMSLDIERYQEFLEVAPDAMFVVDDAGAIVVVNALAERLFGYRREEMLGQPIEVLVPERVRDQHVIQRRSFVATPQTRAMASGLELAARRQDGTEFPAEISLGPLRTAGGLLVFAAVRDITERRRAEAELREQKAELLAAGLIQRHLLPSSPPVLPGFEIAGRMFSARAAAGDHFDYLQLRDGRLAFLVGDVSGKGVGPAVFMAAVHARLSVLAESTSDVSEILSRANAWLSAESDPSTFVTAFLGCLDPPTRTLTYANAGHPPGFVLDLDGQVRCTLDSTSLPLAIDPEARFPVAGPVVLQPGDTVLVLTDGVLEAANLSEDFFGSDRTLDVLRTNRHRPAGEILEALYEAVCAFTHPERPQDDVTAVVVKVL
jgi:PAS domain S-box-containing protein